MELSNFNSIIRQGSKPHIQLDLLSADNLISAAKRIGGVEPVPDRKPSAKVTLFLPKQASTSSSVASPISFDELKKAYQFRSNMIAVFLLVLFLNLTYLI